MNQKSQKIGLKRLNWRTYTMIFAFVLIAILLEFITKGIFLAPRNFSNLMRTMSITGVITVGAVLLIISGNFDLAVGSIVALTGGIAAILHVDYGWGIIPVILTSLACGAVIGVWQGFWVAYKKIPSFIVTLGGMMAFRGIYLALTNGITITPLSESFQEISAGFVPGIIGIMLGVTSIVALAIYLFDKRASRKRYGFSVEPMWMLALKLALFAVLIAGFVWMMNSYNGIPYPVFVFIVLLLLFSFVATRTRFGRIVYAIGGNLEAARLSGINVRRNILYLYIITGVLSAISGILLTSRLNGATSAAGNQYEMDVISSCVIGGTSLSGGKGTVFGALIGALIIASLDNGMSLMNLTSSYQSIVKGLVLIFAVWFDVSSQAKS